MDGLAGLLDGPRAHDAYVLLCRMSAPWCLRIEDESPLTLVAVTTGTLWLTPDDGPPQRLAAGDVMVARAPGHYRLGHSPDAAARVVIGPGQECRTLAGEPLAESWSRGVRSWGNTDQREVETAFVTGAYWLEGEVSARLLRALPPLLVVPGSEVPDSLVALLAAEVARDAPGQQLVLDRLLDLTLVSVLRAWWARPQSDAPGWYAAHDDPVVGPVLDLVQQHPERPWTVATLAREAGVSRALLARRFTDLVGEPPIAFLTGWRIALAADLLLEPGATLAAVARRVGYANAFALSAAFTRVRGVSPREHRRGAVQAESTPAASSAIVPSPSRTR